MKKENKILFGILTPIFLGYLWLVWQPIERLLSAFLADDTFYYLKTAQNIARGLGPTFDGEHLTNGYHPLWMGISTVIYYLFPGDKVLPIHLILTLSVFFFAGTVFLCWDIVRQLVSDRRIAAVLTLAYALNPWNVSNALNGLETPLALFLLALLFRMFLGILRERRAVSDFIALGAVGGLMVLARLDYGLFLAAIFFYFLFDRSISRKFLAAFFLPAFLLAFPWFLYNYIYFGSWIPASGLAYTLLNHRLWFYKPRTAFQIAWWSLYNFIGTIAFTLRTIGLPNYYSGYDLWRSFWSLGVIFLPVIAAFGYFYAAKKERLMAWVRSVAASDGWRAFLVFFIPYLGLVFVHGALRWSGREWYFASFSFLVTVALAVLLDKLSDYAHLGKIVAAFSLLLVFSYSAAWGAVFTQYASQQEMYDSALWVRDHLPADARIAAFNSGIMGYFSGHFVMNSDGLINNAAYEALQRNRLWDFFLQSRIDYIIDYEITLTYRFRSFLGIADPMATITGMGVPAGVAPVPGGYAGSHIGIFKLDHGNF